MYHLTADEEVITNKSIDSTDTSNAFENPATPGFYIGP